MPINESRGQIVVFRSSNMAVSKRNLFLPARLSLPPTATEYPAFPWPRAKLLLSQWYVLRDRFCRQSYMAFESLLG